MYNLPQPDPPFMVQPTFEIKADLFPLPSTLNGRYEHTHFVEDLLLETYIAQRLERLQHSASQRRLIQTDDPVGLAQTLWQVFGLYAQEYPQLLEPTEGGFYLHHLGLRVMGEDTEVEVARVKPTPLGARVADWLEGQTGVVRLLDALSLSCQEDLVVMRDLGQAGHGAEALSVCFPSGWNPHEKLLGDFVQIHQPIADNQRLLGSSANVMKALFSKGPFIRFSWGLTPDGDLDHHPLTRKPPRPADFFTDPARVAEQTFLRMERQTTKAFPEMGRGLFTIRIYVTPLKERLAADPTLRPRLIQLIRSVKPEVLAYKGMARLVPPLLEWLEQADLKSSLEQS